MPDHRTVVSLIKDALNRHLAERHAQGEPLEGRVTGFWIHLVFALLVIAILYSLYA
jgi:hypothetical protein